MGTRDAEDVVHYELQEILLFLGRKCLLSLKKGTHFKRKLRSNSLTPMPLGVGVNEVLLPTFLSRKVGRTPL